MAVVEDRVKSLAIESKETRERLWDLETEKSALKLEVSIYLARMLICPHLCIDKHV